MKIICRDSCLYRIFMLSILTGLNLNFLTGCNATGSAAICEDYKKADISIVVPGTGRDKDESVEWRIFREKIAEWESMHPEVNLLELPTDHFDREAPAYALNNALPDIYFIGSGSIATWADYDYVLDISDLIEDSPYAEVYEMNYFDAFRSEDNIYAIPAFSAGSRVIVYDTEIWQQNGYAEFPQSWEDLQTAAQKMKAAGYDGAVAFGNDKGQEFFEDILTPAFDQNVSNDWFSGMQSASTEFSFLDSQVVSVLQKTANITECGIFQKNYNKASQDEAEGLFLEGKLPALLCSTEMAQDVLKSVQEEDLERYAGLGFAAVPEFKNSNSVNETEMYSVRDMSYGLALNPALKDNPEKQALCLDLAEYVTGPEYSAALRKETGLGGLCSAEVPGTDDVKERLYRCIYEESIRLPELTDFLDSNTWSSLSSEMYLYMTGKDAFLEKVSKEAQDTYEKFYYKKLTKQASLWDSYEDEVDAVMEQFELKRQEKQ